MRLILLSLGISSVVGFILSVRLFSGKFASWSLTSIHSSTSLLGIFFLAYELSTNYYESTLTWGLSGLFTAAILGVYLLVHRLKRHTPPRALVIMHASIAVVSFFLIIILFSNA